MKKVAADKVHPILVGSGDVVVGASKGKSTWKERTSQAALLFSLAMGALVVACSVMSYYQLLKYLNGQVTVAYSLETAEELDFPAVTICPGFKRDRVVELQWPGRPYDPVLYFAGDAMDFSDTFPGGSDEEMEAVWDGMTYDVGEVLYELGSQITDDKNNTDLLAVLAPPETFLETRVGCHEIRRHDTLTAKCYTVYTYCKQTTPHKYINLLFKFDKISEDTLTVAIHHPKAYLGSNMQLWPGPVSVTDLKMQTDLDLVLTKKVKKRRDGVTDEDDFYDCANSLVRSSLAAAAGEGGLCRYPSFKSLMGANLTAQLDRCPTEKAYFAANMVVTELGITGLLNNECVKPASETSYEVSKRENRQAPHLGAYSNIFVSLGSMEAIVEEEYTLQDFYAIVATLGGSVGIFLGWSLLDVVKLTVGFFTKNKKSLWSE